LICLIIIEPNTGYAALRSERVADTVLFPPTKSPNGFPQRSHGTALGARFYPTLTPRTCLNRATSAW